MGRGLFGTFFLFENIYVRLIKSSLAERVAKVNEVEAGGNVLYSQEGFRRC